VTPLEALAHGVDSVQEAVLSASGRLLVRAGGTKGALSAGATLDVGAMRGVLQYDPQEYTFTALAGTPLAELDAMLAAEGQALPFDPPFAAQGATIGGTVAAGLSGPGRYRYGGVRDFVIGVRFVAGDGRLVTGGGLVVKNAAGFDLPKLMVGSLGRFGVLIALTFKVFPRPAASASLVAEFPTLAAAVATMQALSRSSLDLAALELEPLAAGPGARLLARVAGRAEALEARIERLRAALGVDAEAHYGDADERLWRAARDGAWAGAASLVKVALTSRHIEPLDAALERSGSAVRRRYGVGGDVAYLAWPEGADPAPLRALLAELGRPALALTGAWDDPLLVPPAGAAFAARVASVLDPLGRFAAAPEAARAA
jgi:glycolate oxidase FAD binding subunit